MGRGKQIRATFGRKERIDLLSAVAPVATTLRLFWACGYGCCGYKAWKASSTTFSCSALHEGVDAVYLLIVSSEASVEDFKAFPNQQPGYRLQGYTRHYPPSWVSAATLDCRNAQRWSSNRCGYAPLGVPSRQIIPPSASHAYRIVYHLLCVWRLVSCACARQWTCLAGF